MTDAVFTYSEADFAWVTPEITLEDDTLMKIKLKSEGRVVIKKKRTDATKPKISISPCVTEAEYLLRGESEGVVLQVFVAEEPEYIRYEKINEE